MKIFVCIKQVPDTETRIKIAADGRGIDTAGIKWILCPYDEFAVEEAIRFKEKNAGTVITAVSVGPDRVVESLRTALAMGCDEAIHVAAPEFTDSFVAAKSLAKAIEKDGPAHIVFTGKQAIDDDAAQVTQSLAEFLNFPAVTVALKAEYGANSVKVDREIEGGAVERYEVPTPCVLAAQKGMNEPRYASLPNIMKAKKKEIKKFSLNDLGVEEGAMKIRYSAMALPPDRQACKMISGDIATQAKELARLLREEAKVI